VKKCLFLLLAGFFFVTPVHADYNQSYSDYQFLYSQYRKSFQDFTVAKATYLTYKTLTTQNDTLEKMRQVLSDRADIISGYINLISEKTKIGEGIPVSQVNTFQKVADLENSWLASHKRQIAAAETIDDLDTISADFDTRYPIILDETQKAVSIILVSKNDYVYAKMPDLFTRTETHINRLPTVGEDAITPLRSLAVAQSKAQLWEDKRAEAMALLTPKTNGNNNVFNLYKAQELLIQGLQYLKESTSFLKEIVDSLT